VAAIAARDGADTLPRRWSNKAGNSPFSRIREWSDAALHRSCCRCDPCHSVWTENRGIPCISCEGYFWWQRAICCAVRGCWPSLLVAWPNFSHATVSLRTDRAAKGGIISDQTVIWDRLLFPLLFLRR